MNILVTGGLGYIGSHIVERLEKNHNIIIVDKKPPKNKESHIIDITSKNLVNAFYLSPKIDLVIHCAAAINSSESVSDPRKYYFNNVIGTFNLLKTMEEVDCKKIIFLSSTAIYHLSNACYGFTKTVGEKMINDFGLNYVILRLCNVAGVSESGLLKEEHSPETHIIPSVLECIKRKRPITVFGNNYPTLDKTAVRDYVSVNDVSKIVSLCVENFPENIYYTIGLSKGYSIKEVIKTAFEVTGQEVDVNYKDINRPGDIAHFVSDSLFQVELKTTLGFEYQYKDLKSIIQNAWRQFS